VLPPITRADMSGIAIYEPDDMMHGLLREWLSEAGHAVRESKLPSVPAGGVDLAIVSISRPKQQGDVLIRRVRALHPRIPIIALSSQARAGLCSAACTARTLGVERLMAKPLRRSELLAAVQAVSERRQTP
jgi:DNA-binding response OmpR family regulator